VVARVPVRTPDPNAPQAPQDAQAGGRGRGGPFGGRGGGQITQVLWASAEVTIDGRDVADVGLNLQPGMTIAGRVAFESGNSQPPSDLTTVRLNLQPLDPQAGPGGPGGPAGGTVDASGNFTITGVSPGRYSLHGNLGGAGRGAATSFAAPTTTGARGATPPTPPTPASAQPTGSWTVKSAVANGVDAMDFPLDIKPNESISGILVSFSDKSQQLSGTLTDSMGRPTSDYTIILFPADNRYWTPQSRRILSARPSTDGTYSFSGFPAGQYRLTAVTDAEPGEWYDPAFLSQVVSASMSLTIAEGEKKTQDIRLAGGH
jgi:hypothetical protein